MAGCRTRSRRRSSKGPFDLLLHLILKEEVDLWEISLARIVDVFCAEVEAMERVDLDSATEFLLIAATLVELKARRLLPGREDVDIDEELLRFEERDLLLARLLECKTFQDAAKVLHDAHRRSRAARSRARPAPKSRSVRWRRIRSNASRSTCSWPRPSAGSAPKVEPEVRTDHVAPIRASVRDAIDTVLALLPRSGTISFRDLATGAGAKLEVIVRFLAVLELFKQGVGRPRAVRELRRARACARCSPASASRSTSPRSRSGATSPRSTST